MKPSYALASIAILVSSCGMFINKKTEPAPQQSSLQPVKTGAVFASRTIYSSPVLISRVSEARKYARENNFSTSYCFFVDMSMHSGRKRFFVFDLQKNVVLASGLVAHGSCRENYLNDARFSNTPGCGCTSIGKYRVGERYRGQYGKSYKLYGLEPSNSNAYRRAVVLHGFSCVPDEEIYPRLVCNSLGCAMVSPNFFNALSFIIDRSNRPIILWIYK